VSKLQAVEVDRVLKRRFLSCTESAEIGGRPACVGVVAVLVGVVCRVGRVRARAPHRTPPVGPERDAVVHPTGERTERRRFMPRNLVTLRPGRFPAL